MNKTMLIGRLTRDPEVRYSQGETATAIARFTLAVDRRFKRAGETQDADFIGCVAFGKQAEFVEKYFKQGMKMVAVGRIQTGSYTNKEGAKVYTTDVVVEEVEFAESKGNNSDSGNQGNNGYHKEFKPEPSTAMGDGFMNIPDGIDEELPFN
jgi:single-strand DNA-binding protein